MEVVHRGGATYLRNPTPYYFAVTKVKVNGKAVSLTPDEELTLSVLAPRSEVAVSKLPAGTRSISVDTVNDWGGVNTFELKG